MASPSDNPQDVEALQRQIAKLQAQLAAAQQASLAGTGAVSQGYGVALGERAVQVDGDSLAEIVTGTKIVNHYHAVAGPSQSKEDIARQVAGYLRWLRSRTECIELRGIERAGGAPVVLLPLETAYVPLRARASRTLEDGVLLDKIRRPARRGPDADPETGPTEHDLDIELNQLPSLGRRLVITGGPGCGKTTVLLHMAWALAVSLLTGQADPARSRLGLEMPAVDYPLPILVPLASFARYRRSLPVHATARDKTLAHFISHHLISKQADFDLPADFFVQLLKDGSNVLLLLDGLDEVASEDERAEVRQAVEDLVAGRDAMRVIVTCRSIAYRSGRTALGADFREVAVQPLERETHVAAMVRQAYRCIFPLDEVLRNERVDDLLASIERLEQERQQRLGENADVLIDSPLMVRLLLIVHVNNRTLPDERAELFDKAINALLQVDYGREESDIRELSTDWKLFRDMAQHLAFHLHGQGSDQGREIEEAALRRTLRSEDEFKPRAEDFLRHARERGSVLEERDGVYRFIHLAFQEFLVARYLREVIGGDGREAILASLQPHLDDPWWREPILLLAGYLAANAAKSARDFLGALAAAGDDHPDRRFSAAELAATAALEWREAGPALRGDCANEIVALLRNNDAMKHSSPVVRARAGDRLGQLGDPRFDPRCFHLPGEDRLGFVPIPADPHFRIGTRAEDTSRMKALLGIDVPENEINDEPTPSGEFQIARYPVTVAQFRAFVEATGYEIGDADALRDPDNRPVRWVSWHEAQAYCCWLDDSLRTCSEPAATRVGELLRSGAWCVALPSELEWEKAARGGLANRFYPWGDEPDPNRANFNESQIGDTSSVGCFPANGHGLFDLCGNVFEWTRSLWGTDWDKPDFPYPYVPDDAARENPNAGNEVFRVVRGGSWHDHRDYARCAYRLRLQPVLRLYDIGFRVVLRRSPVCFL
jgi:formylglycine-generating enzyme required for sulfatase activity